MDDIKKQASVFENEHVKTWKKASKKVVGYACLATPIEVIEAAGLLPYRLRALGNSHTELADAHLSRFNCSYCRSLLQLGLDGEFDFLDGLIETNGCDHLRGMFENWQYVKNLDFMHYVKVPHVINEDSQRYFEEEIRLFAKALEDKFGTAITDKALWQAIENQEKVRAGLRRLYEMREQDKPAFTGTEVFQTILLGGAMPSVLFAKLLNDLATKRENHDVGEIRARLMLCGSATDEVEFLNVIESIGGMIVTDAMCYGARAFWPQPMEKKGDPYALLAKMYLENNLCPRMFEEFHARRDYVFRALERAKVDGVIVVHNKFCDVHGVDNVQLRMALEKKGVLVLQLEKEYGATADLGRMKTRIQAFLERIGDGR